MWINIWQLHWTVNHFLQKEEAPSAINPEKKPNKQKRVDYNPHSLGGKKIPNQNKNHNKTNKKLKIP